jgi:hypothetical protein
MRRPREHGGSDGDALSLLLADTTTLGSGVIILAYQQAAAGANKRG